MEFQKFDKIPRLSRDIVITEKIDGTNAQIYIVNRDKFILENRVIENPDIIRDLIDDIKEQSVCELFEYLILAGSRKRWLDVSSNGDNFGFAKWVQANAEELLKLGEGRFYGEWYGKGIQRNYGLDEKRFALFNIGKWNKYGEEKRLISINPKTKEERYTEDAPKCCDVVPILYKGEFNTIDIKAVLADLKMDGSSIVDGFMNPEGIVIYHKASGQLFKKTIENDEKPKNA